jgi:hypothetical protein
VRESTPFPENVPPQHGPNASSASVDPIQAIAEGGPMRRPSSWTLPLIFAFVGCGDDSAGAGGGGGGEATSSSASGSTAATTSSSTGGSATSTGQGGSDAGAGGASNPDPCDLVDQDCTAPPETKCALQVADDGSVEAHCAEPLGDVALGEECVRPDGVVGEDTCAPGLYCSFLDSADVAVRTCHGFCETGGGCAEDEVCVPVMDPEGIGVCAGDCDPFVTGSCVPGAACTFLVDVDGLPALFCAPGGAVAAGETCTGPGECQVGLTCVFDAQGRDLTCQPYCDEETPCADDATCILLDDFGGDAFGALGYCQP